MRALCSGLYPVFMPLWLNVNMMQRRMRRESSSCARGHPNPCLLLADLSGLTPSILSAAATPCLGTMLSAVGMMLGTVLAVPAQDLAWQGGCQAAGPAGEVAGGG